MIEWFWLAAGWFGGAIARYAVQSLISSRWPTKLPWGTLIINLLGSFLLGWLMASERFDQISFFLETGFMGAFTTFSTFKLESLQLLGQREGKISLLYLGLTYLLGFGAVWLGFRLG